MRYLITALITAGIVTGIFLYGKQVGAGQVQAEWTTERLNQDVAARAREHELLVKIEEQEKEQYENEQQNQRIIADLRAADVGLRNVISARAGTDNNPESITAAIANTARYRQLFGQCTERYAAMAERADAVNLQAHGLQGYVNIITSP